MSYGRDRDAHTRGVGAIAAADFRNPKRARIRAHLGRALRARDRALSNYVMGSINLRDPRKVWATDTAPPLGTDRLGGSTTGVANPKIGYKPVQVTGLSAAQGVYAPAPSYPTGFPVKPPSTTTKPVSDGFPVRQTTTSSGGYAAGSGPVDGQQQAPDPVIGIVIPPGGDLVPVQVAGMSSNKKILIAAALAGGAYLLLRKKGG